jgi:hypothetical protein
MPGFKRYLKALIYQVIKNTPLNYGGNYTKAEGALKGPDIFAMGIANRNKFP